MVEISVFIAFVYRLHYYYGVSVAKAASLLQKHVDILESNFDDDWRPSINEEIEALEKSIEEIADREKLAKKEHIDGAEDRDALLETIHEFLTNEGIAARHKGFLKGKFSVKNDIDKMSNFLAHDGQTA